MQFKLYILFIQNNNLKKRKKIYWKSNKKKWKKSTNILNIQTAKRNRFELT